MNLIENIDEKIKEAMKANDKETLSIARIVKTDLVFNTSAEKPRLELDVLKTSKKKLLEEQEVLLKVNDTQYIEKIKVINKQLKWLEQYLPKELSKEEILEYIDSLEQKPISFPEYMKCLKEKFQERFDGKLISEVIKGLLK